MQVVREGLAIAAFAVDGLEPGLYHYSPREFALRKLRGGAETLSLGEAAIIAGLVKAPSNYSPTADAEAARGRSGVVAMAVPRLAEPDPFFLLATENPIEQHGTYPLPEGQLDRFAMTVGILILGLGAIVLLAYPIAHFLAVRVRPRAARHCC